MFLRFVFFVVLVMAVFLWTRDLILTGKAIDLIDKHPHPVWTPRAHYWVGHVYYLLNDNKRAVICFETIINKYPKAERREDAEYMMCLCYENTNYPVAVSWLKKMLKDYPKTSRRVAIEKKIYILQQ